MEKVFFILIIGLFLISYILVVIDIRMRAKGANRVKPIWLWISMIPIVGPIIYICCKT